METAIDQGQMVEQGDRDVMGELSRRLDEVHGAILTPLVRQMLENDNLEVMTWRYESVEGGFGNAYGVFRFLGEAKTSEKQTLSWSLILKVIGPPGGGQAPDFHQAPTAVNDWKREVLVWQSSLLDDLPGGLTAPRCLGVAEYPNQECWLWFEEVVERGDGVWSLDRYGLAARHLGQFNGAYLVGKVIPQLPWLSTDRLRRQLALAEPGMDELPELSQHPLFAGLLPGNSFERSLRVWAQRERLLVLLDQLPQTLCHHDAFRRNLIARNGQDGRAQTVAIDWAEVGRGWVGEEIVSLFAGSLRFVAFESKRIGELDATIFAGYVAGLRDAGWWGDARLARFGFAATAALSSIAERAIKWPRVARRAAALPADVEPPRLLNAGGRVQAVAKDRYLINLGEEALMLLDILAL